MNRREFLQAGAAAGAGLLWTSPAGAGGSQPSEDINIALVGVGDQGRTLMYAALAAGGLRIRAVCDIWPYRRRPIVQYLKTCRQDPREYATLEEMLAAEKDLQAVIIATPDFLHAPQAIACMKAGLHVYCERPMAISPDSARAMVRSMCDTGRLLQVGYQRRSSPRYQHARQRLLEEARLLGRITHINSQWTSPVAEDPGWPKRFDIPEAELQRHGYAGMREFRCWRQYRNLGAGLFAEAGAQQIDVAGWFLGAWPAAVLAAGGADYYGRPTPDNVMCIAEYATPEGLVRAFHQVLTTTSAGGGSNEHFMGTEGSLRMSEHPAGTAIYREAHAPQWDRWLALRYLSKDGVPATSPTTQPEDPNAVRVRETGKLVRFGLPITLDKPPHQLHLENFLDAIRGKAKLTCPADVALPGEIAAGKVAQAMESGSRLPIAPEEYAA